LASEDTSEIRNSREDAAPNRQISLVDF
jgi:hypothetical protein